MPLRETDDGEPRSSHDRTALRGSICTVEVRPDVAQASPFASSSRSPAFHHLICSVQGRVDRVISCLIGHVNVGCLRQSFQCNRTSVWRLILLLSGAVCSCSHAPFRPCLSKGRRASLPQRKPSTCDHLGKVLLHLTETSAPTIFFDCASFHTGFRSACDACGWYRADRFYRSSEDDTSSQTPL